MAISRYGARVLPNTRQIIAEADRRGELVLGPHVARFEAEFARRLGGVQAVAASYGRMAFYYILKALDLPAGGEVVLPALTFWVMPEMARVAGCTPVFADVDPRTFNVTPDTISRAITPRTVAIVPTHLWGLPCDMDGILDLARRHRLAVIEDCAHALGAAYRGRPVGTLGDAAIFSFQLLKPLNTYGGGMAVARDPVLAARIAGLAAQEPAPSQNQVRKRLWQGRVQRTAIRPHVFTWTLFPILWTGALLQKTPDVYLWETIRPLDPPPDGYRERYSNVQAALGLEALGCLDRWTSATQANAARMTAALGRVPGITLPEVPEDRTHVFYQYCAYVPSRREVVRQCLRRGVDLETLHVDVCPSLALFERFSRPTPGAGEAAHAIQIPVYESLTRSEVDRVATVVRSAALRHAAPAHAAAVQS